MSDTSKTRVLVTSLALMAGISAADLIDAAVSDLKKHQNRYTPVPRNKPVVDYSSMTRQRRRAETRAKEKANDDCG